MAEVLRREIALACSPAHAFRAFLDHVDLWWPRGHRKFADGKLRFDGSAIVDTAADGTTWTMARVREMERGARLVLDWFPGSPQAPTSVEIAFDPSGDGTKVTIIHQALTAPAEEIWSQRIAIFARGWDAVLTALNKHIGETNG